MPKRGKSSSNVQWLQERLQQPRGESAWPADLAWAHEVTRGELAAPPTEVDEEVVQAPIVKSDWDKTPRNAPCPCGSGKKFKLCHGSA